jgi:hypothetical protein
MNKTSQLVGTGIALIVGSVLAVAPVAAAATREQPARICVDNASSGQCETVVRQIALPGGSGQEVVARPTAAGRIDAKDHPKFGQITPESPGRDDAKDHPNYGSVSAPGGGGGVIPHNYQTLRKL